MQVEQNGTAYFICELCAQKAVDIDSLILNRLVIIRKSNRNRDT